MPVLNLMAESTSGMKLLEVLQTGKSWKSIMQNSSSLPPNLFLLNTGAVFCFETRAKDEELWKHYRPCGTEKKIELQII